MAIIEGDKRKVSVVEVSKPGSYTVDTHAPRPKDVAIVSDTKNGVVEISQKGIQGPQGERGPSIVIGSGAPTIDDGVINDLYFDTESDQFWGPKGELGWPSEPFFSPSATTRYIHTQPSSSDTWVINHNLGGYPSVTVVDSASTVVLGEVTYISTSQIRVSFSAPFSGFAYLT